MLLIFGAMSIFGLAVLALCVFTIVSPFIGWKYIFLASEKDKIVQIPKAGVYSICCVFDVYVPNVGLRGRNDVFPNVNFTVLRCIDNNKVDFVRRSGLTSSFIPTRKSIDIGFFKVHSPGEYLISRISEMQNLGDEEILIRKYLSFAKLFVAGIGIAIGYGIFIIGITLAIGAF